MRAKWLCLAALAAGCGPGHAIFNVDVYSFMSPAQHTVSYVVPPTTPNFTTSSPAQRINLPGVGSSLVDSIMIFGTDSIYNTSGGPGTIGLQVFMASDSLGTFTNPDTALTVIPKAVSGVQTIPDTVRGKLRPNVDSLFTKSKLWVRVEAQASNSGPAPLQGKMVLQSLLLTVVITDKIF